MKRYITFAFMGIFLSGCVETVSLLGPMTSATNGKIAQSAVNSAINHGIKKNRQISLGTCCELCGKEGQR